MATLNQLRLKLQSAQYELDHWRKRFAEAELDSSTEDYASEKIAETEKLVAKLESKMAILKSQLD